GWQNQEGTQFSLCSAKNETPPPSVEPLVAVWFFRASSWKEANRAWYARNGWTKAGGELPAVPWGRGPGPEAKRAAPRSRFSRASTRLPAFDVNPLRSGLLPLRRRAWAVRALSFLPATVFQMANLHPARQPLQP